MPTALELTSKGWKRYLEAPRRRPTPPEPTAAERRTRERLLALVRRAAAMLKSRFGVRRVVLFGSLADSACISAISGLKLKTVCSPQDVIEYASECHRIIVIGGNETDANNN